MVRPIIDVSDTAESEKTEAEIHSESENHAQKLSAIGHGAPRIYQLHDILRSYIIVQYSNAMKTAECETPEVLERRRKKTLMYE